MKTIHLSNRLAALAVALLVIAAERAAAAWFGVERLLPGVESGPLLGWAIGHCDSLDGPVITAARRALETENVNHVLPWVRPEDEHEIRHAFDHALAVRKLGADARELADRHFFETLVRVHRMSEGAPYTGLKPAGTDVGPAVSAADRALDTGYVKTLVGLLIDTVRSGVHLRHHAARELRHFAVDNIAAGREYVAAYESYVHYVEQLWEAATHVTGPHGRGPGHDEETRRPAHLH
jgi:hypothetical protein